MSRKVLGRGLEALISSATATEAAEGRPAMPDGGVAELRIERISPNPFQPRTRFDDDALKELADSIRSTGVIQPIIVRASGPSEYQLVAGERRLRAAQLAGLDRIPAIVRKHTDEELMELALIENIQREDLNPIDEAKAFHALIERIGLTHEQVSERVGKQRSSISNSLRLLVLPAEVMDMVSRGTLSAGHARAILGLDGRGDQLAAARYVTQKGFSVRRTESFIRRKLRREHSKPRTGRTGVLEEWETKLQQRFGTHVAIRPGRKGGSVVFEYYGQEDLERLLEAWGVL